MNRRTMVIRVQQLRPIIRLFPDCQEFSGCAFTSSPEQYSPSAIFIPHLQTDQPYKKDLHNPSKVFQREVK